MFPPYMFSICFKHMDSERLSYPWLSSNNKEAPCLPLKFFDYTNKTKYSRITHFVWSFVSVQINEEATCSLTSLMSQMSLLVLWKQTHKTEPEFPSGDCRQIMSCYQCKSLRCCVVYIGQPVDCSVVFVNKYVMIVTCYCVLGLFLCGISYISLVITGMSLASQLCS